MRWRQRRAAICDSCWWGSGGSRLLLSNRPDGIDPYLGQFGRVRREEGLSGGHLVHLEQVGEQHFIVLFSEAARVVLGHERAHVHEKLGQRASRPFLPEGGTRMRRGGVTARAQAGIHLLAR